MMEQVQMSGVTRSALGAVPALPEYWPVRLALVWLRWRDDRRVAVYAGQEGLDRQRRDWYFAPTPQPADACEEAKRSNERRALPEVMSADDARQLLLHGLVTGKVCLILDGVIAPATIWYGETVITERAVGLVSADEVRRLVAVEIAPEAPMPPELSMPAQPQRPKRGPKAQYPWGPVLAKLDKKLEDDGLPEPGDGGQAALERWMVGEFPLDDCPSPTVIRARVVARIAARRRAIG